MPNASERCKIDLQLDSFKDTSGLFGIEAVKITRDKKTPVKWWDFYRDECPELHKFAIRVLSLTCNSFGCERNWSAFEMVSFFLLNFNVFIFYKSLICYQFELFTQVHRKQRNHLYQKKMNDFVFVMCNMKLNDNQVKKQANDFGEVFYHLSSYDDWITEGEKHDG